MSIEAIDAVWRVIVGDSTRKLVLIAIADCARGRDGTGAYESAATYASKAECSERTVQRHITSLLEQGRIREGDQGLAGHIPARHRPIVYDVAMSDDQAAEWRGHREVGRRASSAAYGSKGGAAAAPVLKAKREALARGDNLSPHTDPDLSRGDSRGVILSPVTGDNLSPHMSPLNGHENGQGDPVRGDRWGDTRGDVGVTQTSEPTSYGSNQSQNPSSQPALLDVPDASSAPRGAGVNGTGRKTLDQHFEEFYDAYPRHVGREAARKVWDKQRQKTPIEVILAGAVRFRDDPNLPEKNYIPHPSTWLARGGWGDEPCPERDQASKARARAERIPEPGKQRVPETW